MAIRYDCTPTKMGESLRMNFGRQSTWNALFRVYNRACSTKPTELFANYDIEADQILAKYWIPLAAMGRSKQAVGAAFEYSPGPPTGITKPGATITALGRNIIGTAKVKNNPYFEKPDPDIQRKAALSTPKITDLSIASASRNSGRLGT